MITPNALVKEDMKIMFFFWLNSTTSISISIQKLYKMLTHEDIMVARGGGTTMLDP
jgi:hypothetical protein